MKFFILTWILLLLQISMSFGQSIAVITGLTYGQQNKLYSFKNANCCTLTLYNGTNYKNAIPYDYFELCHDKYPCAEPKAGVVLKIDQESFDEKGEIHLSGMVKGCNLMERKIRSGRLKHSLGIENSATFSLRYHHLKIGYPEIYAVHILNNYINRRLYEESQSQGGFSDIVLIVENMTKNDERAGRLGYLEFASFHELFVFIDQFVRPQAYYQKEARLLKLHINYLDSLLSQSNNAKIDSLAFYQRDLEESQTVYQEYVNIDGSIKKIYSQLLSVLNIIKYENNLTSDLLKDKQWSLDYSIGTSLSFSSSSTNERYFLNPVSDNDSLGTLVLRNSSGFIPGIILAANFHSNNGTFVNYGFLIGGGLGIQPEDRFSPSIYFGGSLILGKRKDLIFSAGVNLANLDRLKSPEFAIGATYNLATDIDNVVEKAFRVSPFVSISFLISRTDKKDAADKL